jgi:hypothetical protein
VHADEVVRLAHPAGRQHVDDVVEVTAVGRIARRERALVVLVERDEQVHAGAADVGPPVGGSLHGDGRPAHP